MVATGKGRMMSAMKRRESHPRVCKHSRARQQDCLVSENLQPPSKTRAASRAGCLNPAKPRAALSWLMIRLETANALRAADTPVTGRDALTKGVDMDQPAEFLLPILPFLVQVFPTPGKETIAWGGFMIIPRRRGVPGRRSCRLDLRLGCRQGLERGEYRIWREFRIQPARLPGLYSNGARNKALAGDGNAERTVGRK